MIERIAAIYHAVREELPDATTKEIRFALIGCGGTDAPVSHLVQEILAWREIEAFEEEV